MTECPRDWLALLVPMVPVLVVFWLTTRKEKVALREKRKRAKAMEPKLRELINELVLEAKLVKTVPKFNELYTGVKAMVDFAEFGRKDVQEHGLEYFHRYLILIRVGYHFRGVPQRFFEQPGVWKRGNYNLESDEGVRNLPGEIEKALALYDARYSKELPTKRSSVLCRWLQGRC